MRWKGLGHCASTQAWMTIWSNPSNLTKSSRSYKNGSAQREWATNCPTTVHCLRKFLQSSIKLIGCTKTDLRNLSSATDMFGYQGGAYGARFTIGAAGLSGSACASAWLRGCGPSGRLVIADHVVRRSGGKQP